MLAAVLALVALGAWLAGGRESGLVFGIAAAGAFVLIAGSLFWLIFRPLDRLLGETRRQLGRERERRRPKDQVAELGELLSNLVEVLQMGEAAQAAESWRDLVRLRAHNRQLVEVGDIGQAINAALPYRETVERALTRIKGFLRADFVALVSRDGDNGRFVVEGSLGVGSGSLDPACCSDSDDCPIRRALAGDGARALVGAPLQPLPAHHDAPARDPSAGRWHRRGGAAGDGHDRESTSTPSPTKHSRPFADTSMVPWATLASTMPSVARWSPTISPTSTTAATS